MTSVRAVLGGAALATLAAGLSLAGDADCTARSSSGDLCLVRVEGLHPTQFALGMDEVEDKVAKLQKKARAGKLDAYLAEPKRHVPVVVGPGGVFYLTDHHHLVRAIRKSELKRDVAAIVKENWSALDAGEFWRRMVDTRFVYLFDERGGGPLEPRDLPGDIGQMRDDPYRSLAWRVREAGGYCKTAQDFSEFRWADFFRKRLVAERADLASAAVIKSAMALAVSPEACGLPGFKKNGEGCPDEDE